MKQILIKLANELDKMGRFQAASVLDGCLERFAGVQFTFPYEEVKRIEKELAKHKSPEEQKLDKRLGDIRGELAELGRRIEQAEKFKNEEKKSEYEKARKELFWELEDIYQKQFDLDESSEFQKKKRELAPEVDYSNANARAVLETLGYDPEAGRIDPHDLIRRVTKLKNSQKQQKKMKQHEREKVDDERYWSSGLSSEGIVSRMDRLVDLAQKAIKYNIKYISYG